MVGGLLYFLSGGTLWRTDGTAAGTIVLREASVYDIGSLQVVGDTLYFATSDAAHGWELWKSDGTVEGTVLAEDVWPGPIGSGASWLTRVGDTLYFAAADPLHGTELRRLDPPARVVGRHVFYNHSAFDGGDAAANAADDGAVASDKQPLLAGQPATFASVTSYGKGINGVMVDVASLPHGETLTADDFDFGAAGNPVSIEVRRGAGVDGSDRITLTWRDYNPQDASPLPQAVANGWLTVTVKANRHTGLAAPDVFSFGNLVGDTGDSATTFRVNALDLGGVKRALNASSTGTGRFDFNRDGRVNALDLGMVKANLNRTLTPTTTTGIGTLAPAVAPPLQFAVAKVAGVPTSRRVWEEGSGGLFV